MAMTDAREALPAGRALETFGRIAGLVGTGVVTSQYLLRFLTGIDLWHGLLDAELQSRERAVFLANWWWFVAYVMAAGTALMLGPRAMVSVLSGRPAAPAFFAACVGAALAGAAMSLAGGGRGVGGVTLQFYWLGLCVLWSVFVAMACWAGRWSPAIRRDWTLYCYALALLPLSTVPAVPLWVALAGLDVHAAAVTAVTLAFPGHLLAAHFLIVEVLDRRPGRVRPVR